MTVVERGGLELILVAEIEDRDFVEQMERKNVHIHLGRVVPGTISHRQTPSALSYKRDMASLHFLLKQHNRRASVRE